MDKYQRVLDEKPSFKSESHTRNSYRQRAFSYIKDKPRDYVKHDDSRPRTYSMPTRNEIQKPNLHYFSTPRNNENELETYKVRKFEVNSKGVIKKRSDSLRSRSSASFSSDCDISGQLSLSSLALSSSQESVGVFKSCGSADTSTVAVFGGPGVGKTALMQQFMTSEYLGGFDTSMGKFCWKNKFRVY